MKIMRTLRRIAGTPRILENINEGIRNETYVLNQRLNELGDGIINETHVLNQRLNELREGIINGTSLLSEIKGAAQPSCQRGLLTEIGRSPQHIRRPLTLEYVPELPFPKVDMSVGDPIGEIVATPEYQRCALALGDWSTAQVSLMSAYSQALLYCAIRSMKPSLVVEIGTYRAGTTKALCAALAANGHGRLHTIDPFGEDFVPNIIAEWPEDLRDVVTFFPVNSMEYFAALSQSGQRSGITFIDGNHDYEFALFDIEAAARVAAPNGFMFIDNTSQAGPFLAAQDFIERRTDWVEQGANSLRTPIAAPFERRSLIDDTDFCVLRGPRATTVSARPITPGQLRWTRRSLKGLMLSIPDGPPGVLHVQCVIRTFGRTTADGEFQTKRSVELSADGDVMVELDCHLDETATKDISHLTVEPWFVWEGQTALSISEWTLI